MPEPSFLSNDKLELCKFFTNLGIFLSFMNTLLIPKENIITRTNPKKYTGELVEKVTHAELTITQADDFILLASGVIENAVAYDPRLIPVTTEEPNTLKYSFKARYKLSNNNENRIITTAITLDIKQLENIDKILIESKNTIFELKL